MALILSEMLSKLMYVADLTVGIRINWQARPIDGDNGFFRNSFTLLRSRDSPKHRVLNMDMQIIP